MAENQIDLKFVTDSTQLEKATKVAERLEKRITNLVNQEAKGRISTDQYSAAIANLASEMQRAAGNNIKARNEVFSYSRAVYQASKATEELSSDLTATAQSFNNVSKSSGNAAAKVNQFGENIKFSGRNVNRFGAYAQQAGYQVGDFAVQVQSGTSWVTALGQQGAQLLGIFGPAGAIAGAALAITTAIVNPLIAAFNAAENLNEELDKSLEKLQEQNRLRGLGGEETTAQIAELTAQLIEQESQISRMEQGVRARTRGREGTTYAEELQRSLEITKQNNKELYEQRDITAARLRILIAQRDAQKALAGDQAQEAENLRQNEELDRNRLVVLEEQRRQREEYVAEMGNFFREQTARINAEREKQAAAERAALAKEAQDRIDSMDRWNAYRTRSNDAYYAEHQRKAKEAAEAAAEEAKRIFDELFKARTLYYNVRFAGDEEVMSQSLTPSGRMKPTQSYEELLAMGWTEADLERIGLKKPRSIGAAADQRESRLEGLMSELMTEQEQVQEWRSNQLELLKEFNDTELALIGGHAEAKFRIEKEYEDRVRALKVNKTQQTTSAISGILSGFAGLMDANNKKQFESQKKFQIAAAVVDGYSAAVSAWDKGMKLGGPGLAAAFTAGSLLKTGGLIKQINSAQYGGGGGGVSGSAAAVPTPSAPQAQRVIVEGLDRNSLYSGEQLSNIFEALYKENKDRGFVFEVAR